MATKKCKVCEQVKSIEEHFYVSYRRGDLTYHSAYCKPCHIQRHGVAGRARRYGLTVDQMNTLLDSATQCEICERSIDRGAVNFDHDHTSGTLRGMLCRDCNLLLGNARDEVSTLEAAIRYLHHHQTSG